VPESELCLWDGNEVADAIHRSTIAGVNLKIKAESYTISARVWGQLPPLATTVTSLSYIVYLYEIVIVILYIFKIYASLFVHFCNNQS